MKNETIRFIGDVHGQFDRYAQLIQDQEISIQVGDMGIGFPGYPFPEEITKIPGYHKFIRGNHDNPLYCREHPMYLGDYGYVDRLGLYYISGARSPDIYERRKNYNWWEDEELSVNLLDRAIHDAILKKPFIIVSHDAPKEIKQQLIYEGETTATNNALQVLFEQFQPAYWIFGHYHKEFYSAVNGTKFVCLPSLSVFDLRNWN